MLPNPLLTYQDILHKKLLTVFTATIHGDLNLQNILVHKKTGHINLIDFATVRQGHALHDLLRLETEVVTNLIPTTLTETNLPLTSLYTLYHQLHLVRGQATPATLPPALPSELEKPWVMLVAIRKMARRCMYNPDDLTEYYAGLTLYLISALKLRSLDHSPIAPRHKRGAFWTAAILIELQRHPPKPETADLARPWDESKT